MTGPLAVLGIVGLVCALQIAWARRMRGRVRGSHVTRARFLGGRR